MTVRYVDGADPVSTTPEPVLSLNTAYDCEAAGHVMGGWMHDHGLPKPTQYRGCVIPGCGATQRRKTPQA